MEWEGIYGFRLGERRRGGEGASVERRLYIGLKLCS